MSAPLTSPVAPPLTDAAGPTDQEIQELQSNSQVAIRINLTLIPLTAVWLGLIAGILQACVLGVKGLSQGHFITQDIQFLWMAPLGEAVVFGIIGLPLLYLSRFLSREQTLQLTVGALACLGTYVVLTTIGGLLFIARLTLAIGVGVDLSQRTLRNSPTFQKLVTRSLPLGLAGIGIIAAGMLYSRHADEQQALAALPEVSQPRPNVLLLVMDTVRADALSNYSSEAIDTPHLDQFSQESVTFESALSPASWTYPSHASMFTGLYPSDLSADWFQSMSPEHTTLAETLSGQGYLTSGFVANNYYCSRPTGLDKGFQHYEDFRTDLPQVLSHSGTLKIAQRLYAGLSMFGIYDGLARKDAQMINTDFLQWLDQQTADRPFFSFLNYFDAHDPYLPDHLVEENRQLTHEEKLYMKNWEHVIPSRIDDELMQLARSAYRSTISELDTEIGQLLKSLEERGLRENTIVIITSDHGELFGEHGCCYHGNNLFRPVVHVPLMIRWPDKIPANQRIDLPVTLRDLSATILDLTQAGSEYSLPGYSLRVTWDADVPKSEARVSLPYAKSSQHPLVGKRAILTESPSINGDLHAVLVDDYYLIQNGDGVQQLFDFQNDRQEKYDLAESLSQRPQLKRSAQELNWILEGTSESNDDSQ